MLFHIHLTQNLLRAVMSYFLVTKILLFACVCVRLYPALFHQRGQEITTSETPPNIHYV